MENLNDLKYLIEQLEIDLAKFYNKGNKAASVRARKILQDIKGQSQKIRKDISDTRKNT